MNLSDQELKLLPQNIHDMLELIGLANTLVVVEKLGGSTWQFAEGKTDAGQQKRELLAEIVGQDVEQLLHQHYAGETLYIAQCKTLMIALRDRAIHAEFDALSLQGLSAREAVTQLSLSYRLSDRWIWKVLKTLPTSSIEPQLMADLFGGH